MEQHYSKVEEQLESTLAALRVEEARTASLSEDKKRIEVILSRTLQSNV